MHTPVVLRPATMEDAEAVADVYLASRHVLVPYAPLAHADAAVRQWIRDHLIPTGRVVVASVDDHIVAMLAVSEDEAGKWVDQLYVHPNAVNGGIGTQLLQHAQATLGPPIRLYTFQDNVGARRFYERHGFKPIRYSDGAENEEHCPDVLYEWRGE